MIEYLRGKLVRVDPNGLVVEAAGLGLVVRVDAPARFAVQVGKIITLPAWLDIHSRGVRLYGFISAEERARFEKLLGIPGVGAGTALKLLPAFAALTAREAHLPEIPGIGPAKRARIARWLAKGSNPPAQAPVEAELRMALEGLGLTPAEARTRATRVAAKAAGASLETLVRMAVKH